MTTHTSALCLRNCRKCWARNRLTRGRIHGHIHRSFQLVSKIALTSWLLGYIHTISQIIPILSRTNQIPSSESISFIFILTFSYHVRLGQSRDLFSSKVILLQFKFFNFENTATFLHYSYILTYLCLVNGKLWSFKLWKRI